MAAKYTAGQLYRHLGTLRRRRTGQHFAWTLEEKAGAFSSTHKADSIAAEERVDGISVIHTNLAKQEVEDCDVARAHLLLSMPAFCLE